MAASDRQIVKRHKDPEDLTNGQFSMLTSHRMGIEHWELSIGQIPLCALK
jgi:hypothetical protein